MAEINVVFEPHGHLDRCAKLIGSVCQVEAMDISLRHHVAQSDLLFICVNVEKGRVSNSVIDYIDQFPVNTIKGAAILVLGKSDHEQGEWVINALKHKGVVVYPEVLSIKRPNILRGFGFPDAHIEEKIKTWAMEVLQAFNG